MNTFQHLLSQLPEDLREELDLDSHRINPSAGLILTLAADRDGNTVSHASGRTVGGRAWAQLQRTGSPMHLHAVGATEVSAALRVLLRVLEMGGTDPSREA